MAYLNINKIGQLNFQINRVLTYGPLAGDKNEIIQATKEIKSLKEWNKTWELLAQKSEREKRYLAAAFAYRMAEFFRKETDPQKKVMYDQCIHNFYHGFDQMNLAYERFDVPYESGVLNVLKLPAKNEKGVLLICGGYDSFIEEFVLAVLEFCKTGYTVILFEGPGQGRSLLQKLYFIHDWEKPTACILDYFNIQSCALVGISWGGYLALRTAAFEKRVRAAVAFDVLYDGFDVMTHIYPPMIRFVLRKLYFHGHNHLFNRILTRLAKKNIMADWAISQGMYITGTKTPYDFYKSLSLHTLSDICDKIDQDILLLAGKKDHYIPVSHYYILKEKIRHAKSLTCRIFKRQEGGEQHCQTGQHDLAVLTIKDWLEKIDYSN